MRRLLLCVAAGATLGFATPASAQDFYTVDSCATATGAAASADGWSFNRAGTQSRTCPRPGIVASEPSSASTVLQGFNTTFSAPAGSRIIGYRLWRSVSLRANWNYTLYKSAASGREEDIVERCWTLGGGCSALGDARNTGAPHVAQSRLDIPALVFHVDCNPGDCPGGGPANVTVNRLQVDLTDSVDPVLVGTPSGDLVDTTRPLSGERTVAFSATDQGSGVYFARVEVDGSTKASSIVDGNGGRCAKPFRYLVPCRTTASGSVSFDTATLPDGPHTIRLLVYDATETNSVSYGPVQVTTANQSIACAPGPAAELVTRFASTRRTALTRRGGRALSLTGTLAGAAPGTPVVLLSRELSTGAPRIAVQNAVTGEGGAFRIGVPAGRSRSLQVAYRPTPTDPLLRCSRALRLRVPARVSFSARRSGSLRFRMSGRLLGGAVPSRGKVVELQGYEGGRWREFRTIRSRADGRFAASYRFKAASAGRRFRVRVRVRTDPSYPFATGYSRAVRLRVR
jgi:hypothetical protein